MGLHLHVHGDDQRRDQKTQTSENDTDLAYLVESWPSLPEHIKAAIKALIDAHLK